MNALGKHVLLELYNCDRRILDDTGRIETILNEAAVRSGATVVNSVFHTFNPHGVSGVVVIAESHLACHTWPEYGYASCDIFSCGDDVDPKIAQQYLIEALGAGKSEYVEIRRGKLEGTGGKLAHKPLELDVQETDVRKTVKRQYASA